MTIKYTVGKKYAAFWQVKSTYLLAHYTKEGRSKWKHGNERRVAGSTALASAYLGTRANTRA